MSEGTRDDLAEVLARRALTLDEARDEAVGRRHAAGGRTARENLADLIDPGTFVEYGRFAIAAQRGRRELDDLIAATPADGLIAGTARVNGELFGESAACAVLSYDYTVLAGTQGALGHRKKDRLFELIERMRLPTVFFAEGGGGRPGDTDYPVVSALDTRAFALWAKLAGLAPRIAVVAGRCFAGNAIIAGCSDLIVATENSSLGMGGPAMIEGGGLGKVGPDEVGPIETQAANGVVDVIADDEAEATAVTKKLLAYFQGPTPPGDVPDQAALRDAVPERQRRAYAVKPIIETLADAGSATFLRERYAPEMVTALARIEGRPFGFVANDTRHAAGAITSEAGEKAASFLELCNTFGLPVVSLVDTPGMMVGPDGRGDRPGPPRLAPAARRSGAAGPVDRRDPAPRLRPRRPGDDRRQHARAAAHRRLALRPPRADGPRGRGATRPAQGAGGDRRRGGARAAGPRPHRRRRRERESAQRRGPVRDRRRDRSGRDPRTDRGDDRRRSTRRPVIPRRRLID